MTPETLESSKLDTRQKMAVLTIGHSTMSYLRFLSLLRGAGVTAVADVRTAPYSRFFSHFNREYLKEGLRADSIAYTFLGKELGGRPANRQLYCDGVADYEKMEKTEDFEKGLDRVIEGAKKYCVALMCSEHDPIDCHRCLLVARALGERDVEVRHILSDGKIISQSDVEDRLLDMAGRQNDDMFSSREERLAIAYRDQARKVAFVEPKVGPRGHVAAE